MRKHTLKAFRILFHTVFMAVCCAVFVGHISFMPRAFAQDTAVKIRTAPHEGFSRMVFDLPSDSAYTLDQSLPGAVGIKFTDNMNLFSSVSSIATQRNFSNIRLYSTSPLELYIDIPKDSDVRPFKIGNRLIVDVTDSPSGQMMMVNPPKPPAPAPVVPPPQAGPEKAAPVSAPKPAPKETPPVVAEAEKDAQSESKDGEEQNVEEEAEVKVTVNVEKPEASVDEEKGQEEKTDTTVVTTTVTTSSEPDTAEAEKTEEIKPEDTAPESGTETITVEVKATDHHEEPTPEVKDVPKPPEGMLEDLSDNNEKNLIVVSATDTVGMAVFEIDDDIYMFSDDPDVSLHGQFAGPDKSIGRSLALVSNETPNIYKVKKPDNTFVRAQGGGIVWRVLFSQKPDPIPAVKPVRKNVIKGEMRSGYILFPFQAAQEVIPYTHPETGQDMFIVSDENAEEFTRRSYSFVDFDILPSYAGTAIVSKVDDLEVKLTSAGVEISRPFGLALLQPDEYLAAANLKSENLQPSEEDLEFFSTTFANRIFSYKDWEMGDLDNIRENKNTILAKIKGKLSYEQSLDYLRLARMYLAHAHGIEALGFLDLAQEISPELEDNPEFIALRGSALALAWESEEAFSTFLTPKLDMYPEIGYWRSFALANLGDWDQAVASLPDSYGVLYAYPQAVFDRLAPVLAEVLLRSGDTAKADKILLRLANNPETLLREQKAALTYLQGELARQEGSTERAQAIWEPLITGSDDLYRAKAGLALARLKKDSGEETLDQVIDRLERLRYAWRGDELETQIHYRLGKAYYEDEEYVKALNILREAVTNTEIDELGHTLTTEMRDIYTDLFLGPNLGRISALDAAALYEQFSELIPVGRDGDIMVERLAVRLGQADLFSRAARLLEHQFNHRLEGQDAVRVGARLAGLRLLNKEPDKAIPVLDKAIEVYNTLPAPMKKPEDLQELSMLKARALAQKSDPQAALYLLEKQVQTQEVNRLRADIAWNAGYWDDAAEALDALIRDRNISMTRPPEEDEVVLVLNRAIALNLADDRIGLANMRETYTDLMVQSDKGDIFEVITRARKDPVLADRQTLMDMVGETALFSDFLESYKSVAE